MLFYLAFKVYRGQDLEIVPKENEKSSIGLLILIGVAVGVLAAFSGIGGGIIMVPFLNQYLKIPIKKAASISLGVISLMALSTVFYYSTLMNANDLSTPYHVGIIIYNIALPVAIGSLALWAIKNILKVDS